MGEEMKVYVVTWGEYSDYGICEVFLDRRKAEIYCAVRNNCKNRFCYYYSIEEYNTHDDKINAKDDKTVYTYKFDRVDVHYGYKQEPIIMFERDARKLKDESDERIVSAYYGSFYIILDKRNDKKALKAAQDKYAQILARMKGI